MIQKNSLDLKLIKKINQNKTMQKIIQNIGIQSSDGNILEVFFPSKIIFPLEISQPHLWANLQFLIYNNYLIKKETATYLLTDRLINFIKNNKYLIQKLQNLDEPRRSKEIIKIRR